MTHKRLLLQSTCMVLVDCKYLKPIQRSYAPVIKRKMIAHYPN